MLTASAVDCNVTKSLSFNPEPYPVASMELGLIARRCGQSQRNKVLSTPTSRGRSRSRPRPRRGPPLQQSQALFRHGHSRGRVHHHSHRSRGSIRHGYGHGPPSHSQSRPRPPPQTREPRPAAVTAPSPIAISTFHANIAVSPWLEFLRAFALLLISPAGCSRDVVFCFV